MNLHEIAGNATASISPWQTGTVQKAIGYTTEPNGKRTPIYSSSPVQLKVQPISSDELKQLDGLNIQGEKRAIYLKGNYGGMVRADGTGGELITLPDGTKWLTVLCLENWFSTSGWVKLAVARQLA